MKRIFLGKNISVDIGAGESRMYIENTDALIAEPTVLAYTQKRTLIAAGEEAREMPGRTPKGIVAMCPVRDGLVTDTAAVTDMLKYLFAMGKIQSDGILRVDITVCTPYGLNDIEQAKIIQSILAVGNVKVTPVERMLAAAYGEGFDALDRGVAMMLISVGKETCEVTVLAYGGVVTGKSIAVGSGDIDTEIIAFIRKDKKILISMENAELLKKEMGTAMAGTETESTAKENGDRSMTVKGTNLVSGLPCEVTVTAGEIRKCVDPICAKVLDTVDIVIQKTPIEIYQKIKANGIVLTGGGALLKGLDSLVSEKTGIPVRVSENPFDSAVLGALRARRFMRKRKLAGKSGRSIKIRR